MAQGSAVGLLTLIPVRNYPRWVRQSIMWGPIVIAGFGAAYLGANPGMAKTLSKQAADTEEPKQSEFDELSEHAPEPKSAGGLSGAVRALVPGVAIGAVMSGSMADAIWADEKIDRGLRRIGIPFPRSVMGVAAGALTWWSVTTENEWDRSKENDASIPGSSKRSESDETKNG